MFARSCPRMGMRFASGNVFYMNRTFTTRHLNSVASPLSAGFITPMRFTSSMVPLTGFSAADGCIVAELSKISEPVGVGRMGDYNIIQVLNGFAMVPTNVLKDAFVCASEV